MVGFERVALGIETLFPGDGLTSGVLCYGKYYSVFNGVVVSFFRRTTPRLRHSQNPLFLCESVHPILCANSCYEDAFAKHYLGRHVSPLQSTAGDTTHAACTSARVLGDRQLMGYISLGLLVLMCCQQIRRNVSFHTHAIMCMCTTHAKQARKSFVCLVCCRSYSRRMSPRRNMPLRATGLELISLRFCCSSAV